MLKLKILVEIRYFKGGNNYIIDEILKFLGQIRVALKMF